MEPASTYPDLGLPPEWYGALEWVFPEWARRHALDKGEAVNFLKGAVVTADRIVTVSQVNCLCFLFLRDVLQFQCSVFQPVKKSFSVSFAGLFMGGHNC